MTAHTSSLIMAMSASDQNNSIIICFDFCRLPGEIEGLRGAATCWDYIALMFVGSYACMHALQCSIMIRTEWTGCQWVKLCRSGLCTALEARCPCPSVDTVHLSKRHHEIRLKIYSQVSM